MRLETGRCIENAYRQMLEKLKVKVDFLKWMFMPLILRFTLPTLRFTLPEKLFRADVGGCRGGVIVKNALKPYHARQNMLSLHRLYEVKEKKDVWIQRKCKLRKTPGASGKSTG